MIQHPKELHVEVPAEVFDPELAFEQQEDVARKAIDQILSLNVLAREFVESLN